MIAITTKFIPATNTKPARIKAYANNNTLTMSRPDGDRLVDMHAEVALALCRKMDWQGTLIAGGNEKGCVFVFSESDHYKI